MVPWKEYLKLTYGIRGAHPRREFLHAYRLTTTAMPHSATDFALLAPLTSLCSAGLQVPLVIINLSPHEVSVDMTLDENCIKHDFNSVDLGHYYDSWEGNNLGNFEKDYPPYDGYLRQCKTQFGLPKLRCHQAPMAGVTNIPALDLNATDLTSAPYMVFETDMDGSGNCFESHLGKSSAVSVNGTREKFTIEDPPTSEWTLSMYYPDNNRIVLCSGGDEV
jgi:hypothetical protein